MNRCSPLLLVALAAACGGKPEVATEGEVIQEPIEACSLNVTLSGTLEGTIAEDASMGCAALDSVESGIDNVFLLSANVVQFQMLIEEVREGETGTGFPAKIYLYDMTSRRWGTPAGACTVDVNEHIRDAAWDADDGALRAYTVAGTGHCSGRAQPTGQGAYGLVSISEFEFTLPSAWRDD